jgi:hypothetical protein
MKEKGESVQDVQFISLPCREGGGSSSGTGAASVSDRVERIQTGSELMHFLVFLSACGQSTQE